ncbi:NAD-reducing hydrogenase HoxS subunit beta [Thalassovita gelatinovora]|uniref:NAD-reducing hydrogenase HoxS subunit beta n=1 Tax=Thalassovita gelatinovora TaxID=53501 RepID=A0A0P1FHU8_THAGE|nr:Ni/Fe hydrogenase subunit alpha [Thalassovita gelatinovora]QIZ82050.1 Ni/Fe hydrogenase subunit alpha [Thalassovita gelatinovora]CUH67550.1 NAD-reducing hydrogenase HoxS subunit beta [Thalassovita gelatinovora]SEP71979.1 NAD(P)-dependent nickel-iron dehydrogenase catalytic subunit [Thalassovita gelatinovora]
MTEPRLIEISPVTRVEGHGKVTIHLDVDGNVDEARLHIVEFRGFERFIRGRLLWEVPVIVQRLCGICPVSHHLAAAKAMDMICGVDQLPPTAEKMRRLMHYGQVMQSHVLHFFHLAAPDLLFGFGAPAEKRNIFEVLKDQPELGRRAILMRKFGQDIIEATAGKKIHGTGAIPGGINKNLPIETRDALLAQIGDMRLWAQDALALARGYTLDNAEMVRNFASFPSHYMSMVRAGDGALDLYDGNLRALSSDGDTIFDHLDTRSYHDALIEDVRSWSYMKFPFIKALGPDDGWYRVGPLARMNTASFIDTPLADAARTELMATNHGLPQHAVLANHWARMIEVLHCVEKIDALLHDPDLQGTDLRATGDRRQEGIGVLEAPRGNLIHHYQVDENDQVTYCNLIVSTTHNNEGMNRAVKDVAVKYLSGQPQITEGMLNHVEVAIRAYDPCLSCATHALGQMPLQVELFDADGVLLDRRAT